VGDAGLTRRSALFAAAGRSGTAALRSVGRAQSAANDRRVPADQVDAFVRRAMAVIPDADF